MAEIHLFIYLSVSIIAIAFAASYKIGYNKGFEKGKTYYIDTMATRLHDYYKHRYKKEDK